MCQSQLFAAVEWLTDSELRVQMASIGVIVPSSLCVLHLVSYVNSEHFEVHGGILIVCGSPIIVLVCEMSRNQTRPRDVFFFVLPPSQSNHHKVTANYRPPYCLAIDRKKMWAVVGICSMRKEVRLSDEIIVRNDDDSTNLTISKMTSFGKPPCIIRWAFRNRF